MLSLKFKDFGLGERRKTALSLCWVTVFSQQTEAHGSILVRCYVPISQEARSEISRLSSVTLAA
jgi:hypothetical protein